MKARGRIRKVVAALIVRGDEIFVCQRRKDQLMPLKWEFPGGKIEELETPDAALRRELREELGIDAEIGPEVAHVRHKYKRGGVVELTFFRVEKFSGELQNLIFQDMRWTKRAELGSFDFLPADKDLVEDIAAGRLAL